MKEKPKVEELFKIPNLLCYLRILMVPIFIHLYLSGQYSYSALIVVLASLTDILDGWIARTFNMITAWGKFIDPVADKLMQISILGCLLTNQRIFDIVLVMVISYVLREIILLITGVYIYIKGRNLSGSKWFGKVCTVVFMCTMFIFLLYPKLELKIVYMLSGIVLGFIYIALFGYLIEYKKLWKDLKGDNDER